MSVLLGLLAALFYGTTDFLARYVARATSAYRTTFYSQIAGLVVLSAYLGASLLGGHGGLADAPLSAWVWAVGAGALNAAAGLALYQAFRVGHLALMAPIVASFGAVAAGLSLLDGARLAPLVWAGIGMAVAGVVVTSIPPKPDDGAERGTAGLGWALAAAGGFGVTFWLLGTRATPALGAVVPVWVFRLTALVLLAGGAKPARQSLRLSGRFLWAALGLGLLDTAAVLCLSLGLHRGPVAVVAVLGSLSSAVTVLLAFVFLRERLSRHQWAGTVMIFLGVVLVNV